MEWIDTLRSQLLALPNLAKFAIVMAGIVGGSALARRTRTPQLVALLAFGVLLGPHVLDVAGANHPIAQFFADLGKLMLMFTCGLGINIHLFRQAQTRSITFGLITTMVPQILGTAFGLAFGYPIVSAVVIGSLLASHTLISLPIVTSLGAIGLEPVVVAISATMVADTLSLIIFGICVSTYTTGFSPFALTMQIVEVAIFVPLILIGIGRTGSWLLTRLRDNVGDHFVALLGIMAVAGLLAELIKLPSIVGAFLAGLAVNSAAEGHPAKGELQFIGRAFFIPIFFVVTGFLVDPVAVGQTIFNNFWLVAGIVASLIAGKGIAAEIAGRVAATLAATLVGYNSVNAAGVRLLDEKTFNAVLVLLVVTSILGPVLTQLFTPELVKEEARRTVAAAKAGHVATGIKQT